MDHVLLPRGVAHDEVLPYFAEASYDRGPFLTYPERAVRKEIAHREDPLETEPKVKADFIGDKCGRLQDLFQTWLFFGLLHEFFGDSFHESSFIRRIPVDKGFRDIITCEPLGELLYDWRAKWTSTAMTSELFVHLKKCLTVSFTLMKVPRDPYFDTCLTFCIVATGEILESALHTAAADVSQGTYLNQWAAVPTKRESSGLITRMIEKKGWCPYEAGLVRKIFNHFRTHYFLSSMNKSADRDHSQCDEHLCQASELQFRRHKEPLHCTPGCRCPHGRISEADKINIAVILDRDDIPVIRLELDGPEDAVKLHIVSADGNTEYVALSHVWADGLGNQLDNSLPQC